MNFTNIQRTENRTSFVIYVKLRFIRKSKQKSSLGMYARYSTPTKKVRKKVARLKQADSIWM